MLEPSKIASNESNNSNKTSISHWFCTFFFFDNN
jgi:hypothetical protein